MQRPQRDPAERSGYREPQAGASLPAGRGGVDEVRGRPDDPRDDGADLRTRAPLRGAVVAVARQREPERIWRFGRIRLFAGSSRAVLCPGRTVADRSRQSVARPIRMFPNLPRRTVAACRVRSGRCGGEYAFPGGGTARCRPHGALRVPCRAFLRLRGARPLRIRARPAPLLRRMRRWGSVRPCRGRCGAAAACCCPACGCGPRGLRRGSPLPPRKTGCSESGSSQSVVEDRVAGEPCGIAVGQTLQVVAGRVRQQS